MAFLERVQADYPSSRARGGFFESGSLFDHTRDRESVEARELDIHEDQVRFFLLHHLEGVGPRNRGLDTVAVRFEDIADQLQIERIVLDDQDGFT